MTEQNAPEGLHPERQAVVIRHKDLNVLYIPATPGRASHVFIQAKDRPKDMTDDNWQAATRFAEWIIRTYREKHPNVRMLPAIIELEIGPEFVS